MTGPQNLLGSPAWRWRNSAWIIVPTLSIGFLTWAAFLYAGIRARRRRWQVMAAGYFVALAVAVVVMPAPEQEQFGVRDAVAMLLITASWIGGTIHAMVIRPDFLRAVATARAWYHEESPGGEQRPADPQSFAVSGDAAGALGLDEAHAQLFDPGDAPAQDRQASPPPPERVPPPPERPTSPPPRLGGPAGPVSHAGIEGRSRVALNSAGEEALAALPGLDPILAKRIVAERRRRGGFGAVEELAECGVPPHVVVRVRPLLKVDGAPQQRSQGERRGRTLDL